MSRVISLTFMLVVLLHGAPAASQVDVAGPWVVELSTPRGEANFRMFIVQKGTRLSGYLLSEVGQFDMKGSVESDHVEFSWRFPDRGTLVRINFTGTVNGKVMSGTAKVGDKGESPMTAQRQN